jgi:glycerate 2-kinase
MDPERFFTQSLRDPRVGRILAAALEAVEPGAAVESYLVSNPLPPAGRVFALGVGKAAVPMTGALSRFTDLTRALVITKHASDPGSDLFSVMESGHPVPDARSLAAGGAALEFTSSLREDDLLVCLISGGGSALMTAPLVPLQDMQALTSGLLASGARIDEINTLRRHLDRVKGGGLAQATKARVLSLILSDVVGSPLEAIASGPTAPDPMTKEDALAVLEKYFNLSLRGAKRRSNLMEPPNMRLLRHRTGIPASIFQSLLSSTETPKPSDPLFSHVQNVIVGDNALAVQAALRQAQNEGFQVESLGSTWQGEAREVGVKLAHKLRVTTKEGTHPFCMIAGGETTVTLSGVAHPEWSEMASSSQGKSKDRGRSRNVSEGGKETTGIGGRNQELALAAVTELAGLENAMLISLATDGEDGPTDAAGAVVNGDTLRRAERFGLDVAGHLSGHDAYPFFERLGDLLKTGPTGTNVNDLVVLLKNQ